VYTLEESAQRAPRPKRNAGRGADPGPNGLGRVHHTMSPHGTALGSSWDHLAAARTALMALSRSGTGVGVGAAGEVTLMPVMMRLPWMQGGCGDFRRAAGDAGPGLTNYEPGLTPGLGLLSPGSAA
jgi:hypothetical protein